MPTVLTMAGWRLFFYANEGDEPIHIHSIAGKGTESVNIGLIANILI